MAEQTVACPQCRTALRSKVALAPDAMLRCPQCGNHFQAAPLPTLSFPSVTKPLALAPSSGLRPLILLLIPATLIALFLGAGAVVCTVLLLRPHSAPAPLVDTERERDLAEKQHQLAMQEKELAAQRDKLTEQERRQKFQKLLDEGKKYLADKDYKHAQTTYEGALQLYPTDKDALDGLVAAKAGATIASTSADEQTKRKAAFDKFMEQGQQAMTAKKYADAVIFFESALNLIPGGDAAQALTDARKELDKDKVEKDKLAAYQKYLAAGNAALTAGRYADAVREFIAAQGVIPGDAVAVKGQKDAEQKLAERKDQDAVDKLVDKGKDLLRDKKYREAGASAGAALRILPGDAAATKLLDDAKKAFDDAQVNYKRLMTAADTARVAGRYEEAKGLYAQALQALPGDDAALKAQQNLQNLLDGQAAYTRYMIAGNQALAGNRFGDAANAFTEALRLAPNDPDATKGLTIAQAGLARLADYNRFMTLATAALNKKLYRDAVAAYHDALVAVPGDPLAIAGIRQAKYLRGLTEGNLAMSAIPKRYAEAIKSYEAALREIPGDRVALNQLSSARYQRDMQDGTAALVAKRYTDAVSLLEGALKERPNDVNAKIQLHEAKFGRAMAAGDSAMRSQRYQDAIVAYQDALREKPSDGRALRALAQAQKLKRP